MKMYNKSKGKGEEIFVGIDLHHKMWHVTVMTNDTEVFRGNIPGRWDALRQVFGCYCGSKIKVVYEAGCFGFWLHDRIVEYGAECVVTPPSLLPQEYGNRVKADKRDSRKLAHLLSKGLT